MQRNIPGATEGTSARPGQGRADRLTRRWWFITLFIFLNFLPPYLSKVPDSFDHSQMDRLMGDLLSNALLISLSSALWTVFDVIPVLLVILILCTGNRLSRLFSVYVAVNYAFIAVLQGVSITEEYGVGVVTCNLMWMLTISGFWFWEASAGLNRLTLRARPLWRYWVAPLAVFAFWVPFAPSGPDRALQLTPLLFTKVHPGLQFCLTTPLYLAILTLSYPRVNFAVLRITALVGVIIGFWNMLIHFIFAFDLFNGLLHVPLLSISTYALLLSFRERRSRVPPNVRHRREEI